MDHGQADELARSFRNLMREGEATSSQGAVVELTVEEDRSYPFVSHDFHDAAKGAFGFFTTNGEKT